MVLVLRCQTGIFSYLYTFRAEDGGFARPVAENLACAVNSYLDFEL